MAATDGGASSSATPAWPGTVSRRLNGVWRLQTPPARGSSVAPETLQICFRNRGDGSVARVAELAVMASGQRLESVELDARPGRGDALVARTPNLLALLVVGPTTLSPRQRQNERLCSFGETRVCEVRERVMFAFQFSNPDDAERCFDALRPWLSATVAGGAFETRASLRAMLGISPEPAIQTASRDRDPGGTRDADLEVLERPPAVPSEAERSRAELMTTAEVMAVMETVTVSAMTISGSATVDTPARAAGDAPEPGASAETERIKSADAEPEPETVANASATETRETQTSLDEPDERSAVEPWMWSSGISPDVPDETARAHVREMLRECLAPGNGAASGAAAAFARAPLGAGMPFDRYARLVGEAMDEMIRTGEIVVEEARDESDDDDDEESS